MNDEVWKEIEGYNGYILQLDSIKDGEILGFNKSHISNCCCGRLKHHKKYKWFYDIKGEI